MRRLRTLTAFLYDFVVGDDPLVALTVVIALGLTAALAGLGFSAWWVMPASVAAILGLSIHRATRV